MRILSIDPGITTGIAICNESGALETALTATLAGLQRKSFFTGLISMSQPDIVLIEALPLTLYSDEMTKIHNLITRWFQTAGYKIESIQPAQWKKLAKRVEIPGQHARDAATMAKWWAVAHRDRMLERG